MRASTVGMREVEEGRGAVVGPAPDAFDVYTGVAMLVVEGRVPGGGRGYHAGPHCPPGSLRGAALHCCDVDQPACGRASALLRQLRVMFSCGVGASIEVLLAPQCRHGATAAAALHAAPRPCTQLRLLESWSISAQHAGSTDAAMTGPSLIAAVRSFLHFSQLSAWLSVATQPTPHVLYRVGVTDKCFSSKFQGDSVTHVFPLASVGPQSTIQISVRSISRTSEIPNVSCLDCLGVPFEGFDNDELSREPEPPMLYDEMAPLNMFSAQSVFASSASTVHRSSGSTREISSECDSVPMVDDNSCSASDVAASVMSVSGNILVSSNDVGRFNSAGNHAHCSVDNKEDNSIVLGSAEEQLSGNCVSSVFSLVSHNLEVLNNQSISKQAKITQEDDGSREAHILPVHDLLYDSDDPMETSSPYQDTTRVAQTSIEPHFNDIFTQHSHMNENLHDSVSASSFVNYHDKNMSYVPESRNLTFNSDFNACTVSSDAPSQNVFFKTDDNNCSASEPQPIYSGAFLQNLLVGYPHERTATGTQISRSEAIPSDQHAELSLHSIAIPRPSIDLLGLRGGNEPFTEGVLNEQPLTLQTPPSEHSSSVSQGISFPHDMCCERTSLVPINHSSDVFSGHSHTYVPTTPTTVINTVAQMVASELKHQQPSPHQEKTAHQQPATKHQSPGAELTHRQPPLTACPHQLTSVGAAQFDAAWLAAKTLASSSDGFSSQARSETTCTRRGKWSEGDLRTCLMRGHLADDAQTRLGKITSEVFGKSTSDMLGKTTSDMLGESLLDPPPHPSRIPRCYQSPSRSGSPSRDAADLILGRPRHYSVSEIRMSNDSTLANSFVPVTSTDVFRDQAPKAMVWTRSKYPSSATVNHVRQQHQRHQQGPIQSQIFGQSLLAQKFTPAEEDDIVHEIRRDFSDGTLPRTSPVHNNKIDQQHSEAKHVIGEHTNLPSDHGSFTGRTIGCENISECESERPKKSTTESLNKTNPEALQESFSQHYAHQSHTVREAIQNVRNFNRSRNSTTQVPQNPKDQNNKQSSQTDQHIKQTAQNDYHNKQNPPTLPSTPIAKATQPPSPATYITKGPDSDMQDTNLLEMQTVLPTEEWSPRSRNLLIQHLGGGGLKRKVDTLAETSACKGRKKDSAGRRKNRSGEDRPASLLHLTSRETLEVLSLLHRRPTVPLTTSTGRKAVEEIRPLSAEENLPPLDGLAYRSNTNHSDSEAEEDTSDTDTVKDTDLYFMKASIRLNYEKSLPLKDDGCSPELSKSAANDTLSSQIANIGEKVRRTLNFSASEDCESSPSNGQLIVPKDNLKASQATEPIQANLLKSMMKRSFQCNSELASKQARACLGRQAPFNNNKNDNFTRQVPTDNQEPQTIEDPETDEGEPHRPDSPATILGDEEVAEITSNTPHTPAPRSPRPPTRGFSLKTGLPLNSSPAPCRRPDQDAFDYDSSLLTAAHRRQTSLCHTVPRCGVGQCVWLDCGVCTACGATEAGEEPGFLRPRPKLMYSTSAPATVTSSTLLGTFEECVLHDRLEPESTVEGFSATVAASGSFCPDHITFPVTVFFYTLCDNDHMSSPYMGHVTLSRKGYKVPNKGTVQVTLTNPSGTVVKMFVVMYDLSDMPPNSRTFLRQRTLNMPVGSSDHDPESQQWLRYLIHLKFSSSKSGKVYLHTDIRMIIFRRSDADAAAIHKSGRAYELRSFTHGPTQPKYSPRK